MRKSIVIALTLLLSVRGVAQTKIGGSAATPADASSVLELSASNRGFLPPRVALTAANSANPISSPATGLLVYNTATAGTSPNNVVPGYYYWDGTAWDYLTNNAVNAVGAIAASSTANGVSITNGVLSLAPADASNGGVITTGTQTIAGAKTFSGNTSIGGTLAVTGNTALTGSLSGANTATSTISGFAATLPSAQTGTTYTLAASDNGKVLQFTSASAVTLTLPSTGLPAGFNCMVIQMGNGQITFSGGATIYNRNSFTKTAGLYSIVTVLYLTSSTAITSGEMSN